MNTWQIAKQSCTGGWFRRQRGRWNFPGFSVVLATVRLKGELIAEFVLEFLIKCIVEAK